LSTFSSSDKTRSEVVGFFVVGVFVALVTLVVALAALAVVLAVVFLVDEVAAFLVDEVFRVVVFPDVLAIFFS
tara:strand:- start:101 stop:319 length:219 start_codon:yes stop_codon:yes gene_type:complete